MASDREQIPNLAPKFPLRVLLVEDNPADAELCLEFLSVAQFELTADVTQTPKDFVDRLQTAGYDVVLADYNLGSWTGLDALDMLQEQGCDVPFILLTAALGDETAIECMKRGVADYVLKERMERLPVAIYRALEQRAARIERRRADRSVEEAEAKFRALAESMQAAVFVEQGSKCSYVNRAAEAITGFPRGELLGMSFWQLIPEGFRPTTYGHPRRHPQSAELPVRYQTQINTKWGSERWLDCTVKLLQIDGSLAALIAAVPIPRPKEQATRSHEPAWGQLPAPRPITKPVRGLKLAARAS